MNKRFTLGVILMASAGLILAACAPQPAAPQPSPTEQFWIMMSAPGGVAKARQAYDENRRAKRTDVLFPENETNLLGYQLLREGNAKDAPPPLKFLDGWNIGEPDAMFEMPAAFSVPSSGTIDYQHVVVPTGFKEDRWVSAVEIRPGNRSVVHHIIAFVRPPGSRWLQGVDSNRQPSFSRCSTMFCIIISRCGTCSMVSNETIAS